MGWNFNKILGSFIIDGNLTAEKYKNMLRDETVTVIQIIIQTLTMFSFNTMEHYGSLRFTSMMMFKRVFP